MGDLDGARSVMGRIVAVSLAAAALLVAACGDDGAERAERPLDLALDFQPNAVHAGIYTARALGLDTDRGLRLRIRPPSSSTDSLKLLEAGRADVAVADIHDLGLARERGADLVGVGAIVQRPLAAVIARKSVRRPRDLENRRVGVTGLPSDDAVLRAVVENDGGDFDAVKRVTVGFSAVPSLVARRVDAATAFWNAEGVALRRRGVRTREFRVDDHGGPRYPELVLVVRRGTLARDRELVADAMTALEDGTHQAIADPDASTARIVKASDADPKLVRAQLDAVLPAFEPPIELDRERLAQWARFDARFGILKRRPAVDRAFDFDARG